MGQVNDILRGHSTSTPQNNWQQNDFRPCQERDPNAMDVNALSTQQLPPKLTPEEQGILQESTNY